MGDVSVLLAIVLLTVGLVIMQLPGSGKQPDNSDGRIVRTTRWVGRVPCFSRPSSQRTQGCFSRSSSKRLAHALAQSIQLSLFAMPISLLTMFSYDQAAIRNGNMMIGFNIWAWITVALSALGGIAVSMTLKYADNILKTFAVGGSIVLNCAVSSIFLGVPLTLQMAAGVLLVVGATALFNLRALKQQNEGQSPIRSPRARPEHAYSTDEQIPLTAPGNDGSGDDESRDASEMRRPSPAAVFAAVPRRHATADPPGKASIAKPSSRCDNRLPSVTANGSRTAVWSSRIARRHGRGCSSR